MPAPSHAARGGGRRCGPWRGRAAPCRAQRGRPRSPSRCPTRALGIIPSRCSCGRAGRALAMVVRDERDPHKSSGRHAQTSHTRSGSSGAMRGVLLTLPPRWQTPSSLPGSTCSTAPPASSPWSRRRRASLAATPMHGRWRWARWGSAPLPARCTPRPHLCSPTTWRPTRWLWAFLAAWTSSCTACGPSCARSLSTWSCGSTFGTPTTRLIAVWRCGGWQRCRSWRT